MAGRDEGIIRETATYVYGHIKAILGGLSLLGTLSIIAVSLVDIFGLSVAERIISGIAILFFFFAVGSALGIYYLYAELVDVRESSKETTLTCLAFEILSGDDGRSYDFDHVFTSMDRTYDLTGDTAYYKNVYRGRVSNTTTSSDGIVMKYIGDYADVDGDSATVRVTIPPESGDTIETEPEVIDETMYDVILKLPFGRSLEPNTEFKLEIECDDFGRTPPVNAKEVRVHFPLHRYRRVDTFDAVIKLPNHIQLSQAAKLIDVPDVTEEKNILLEDLQIVDLDAFQDIEWGEQPRTNHNEYHLHVDRGAATMFLFRFLRN